MGRSVCPRRTRGRCSIRSSALVLSMTKMAKTKSSVEHLSAISTFVCVAESTSLTAAAQKLQMSVSGVSKAVSRLEERLQIRLLNRTSRSINLTEEGAAYFERYKLILCDLEDAEAAIADFQTQPRGRLRLQLPRALGRKVVIPALTQFLQRFRAVTVDVMLDGRSLNLDEEGIDVALQYGLPPPRSPLIARKLCPVRYVACASPDYLQRHAEPRTPDEILAHRCINFVAAREGQYRRWSFSKGGTVTSFNVSSMLNVNDMDAAALAAENGAGVVYLSDFTAAGYLRSGTLRALLPEYIFEGEPVYMVYPRLKYVPRRVRILREFLREILPPIPPWSRALPK